MMIASKADRDRLRQHTAAERERLRRMDVALRRILEEYRAGRGATDCMREIEGMVGKS